MRIVSAGEDAFAGALAFVHNGKIVVCGVEKNGDDGKKLEVTRRLVASGKVQNKRARSLARRPMTPTRLLR